LRPAKFWYYLAARWLNGSNQNPIVYAMRNLFLLSISGGLLLSFSWPDRGFPELLFVALVPLLFLERQISASEGKRVFWPVVRWTYPAFLLFNIWTSWWIWHASDWGSVAAISITALMQSLTFGLFAYIKKQIGTRRALIALPFLWVSLEAFQHWWDLSWPWLHLGQGFATRVTWIQWYAYTGVFAGTLWVWLVNIVLFDALLKAQEWRGAIKKGVLRLLLFVGVPILISWVQYLNYETQGNPVNVVVVQPNLDAYTEKFDMDELDQTRLFVQLAHQKMNDSVDYVVGPETMLPWGFWESDPWDSPSMQYLHTWLGNYPNTVLVSGATTRQLYRTAAEKSYTARQMSNGLFYDVFNTAFQMSGKDSTLLLYHKSRLVVGVEMLPYAKFLTPLLGSLIIDLGGTTGTLGTQANRAAFPHPKRPIAVGVPICYESIYGEFVTEFVRDGAQLLFVITNDGWWQNSPGHRQHMHYARLRAIETRRDVARAANTGISCFINQRGDVVDYLPYEKTGVLAGVMHAHDGLTLYARSGDVLKRISVFVVFFVVISALVQRRLRNGKVQR
jgi:apolipoprotein N-acyltransferase